MSTAQQETIAAHLRKSGVSRRSFLQLCSKLMVAAPIGLALTSKRTAAQVAQLVGQSRRPSVIWLHFQDCTGCTETLLRASAPDVAHLILDMISLDYHETLMAASGAQAEAALRSAIEDNAGKFVLVIEGAIPAKDDGVFNATRRQASHSGCQGCRCSSGSRHCHRFVRFVGRSAFRRPQSHGGCGR